MSILFLILRSFISTNWDYDIPIFLILIDLDLIVFLRLVWTIRHWR